MNSIRSGILDRRGKCWGKQQVALRADAFLLRYRYIDGSVK